MAGWLKGTTWCTASRPPHRRRRTSGSSPSSELGLTPEEGAGGWTRSEGGGLGPGPLSLREEGWGLESLAHIWDPPLYRAAVSVDPFYEMLAARKKRISVKKKQEQP